MRSLLLIIAVFAFQLVLAQKAVKLFKNNSDSIPQFEFGKAEYDSIVYWNKQMPKSALLIDGLTADVELTFDIDTLGEIQNIVTNDYVLHLSREFIENNPPEIMKRLNVILTEEAKRVLLLTDGLWIPAKSNNGKAVKKVYTDIEFSAYAERTTGSQEFLDSMNKYIVYGRFSTADVKGNEYKQSNLFKAGVRKMKEKKTKLAIFYFLQAIALNENDYNSYYNLGICYYRLKDKINACKAWASARINGDTGVQELLDKYCR